MEKENNVVIKQVVIPESCNRGSSTHLLFCNETTNDKRGRFPSPSRTGKLGNDANFMSRCFDGGGFTPALVIPVLAARAKAGYSAGYKCGFTLIELLVVVLIIGILAAVALPQYQKAVEKSKAVQAQTLLKSVYQAAKAYKLANGSWPTSFDELAVEIPWTGNTNWANLSAATQGKSNTDWSIQLARGADYGVGVVVGRISGPYAGAAFAITDTARTNNSEGVEAPTEEMICIEGKQGNAVNYSFAKATGDYCVKLFKGTLVPTGHHSNYFTLP